MLVPTGDDDIASNAKYMGGCLVVSPVGDGTTTMYAAVGDGFQFASCYRVPPRRIATLPPSLRPKRPFEVQASMGDIGGTAVPHEVKEPDVRPVGGVMSDPMSADGANGLPGRLYVVPGGSLEWNTSQAVGTVIANYVVPFGLIPLNSPMSNLTSAFVYLKARPEIVVRLTATCFNKACLPSSSLHLALDLLSSLVLTTLSTLTSS